MCGGSGACRTRWSEICLELSFILDPIPLSRSYLMWPHGLCTARDLCQARYAGLCSIVQGYARLCSTLGLYVMASGCTTASSSWLEVFLCLVFPSSVDSHVFSISRTRPCLESDMLLSTFAEQQSARHPQHHTCTVEKDLGAVATLDARQHRQSGAVCGLGDCFRTALHMRCRMRDSSSAGPGTLHVS
jgi:hypothetical protein